MNKLLNNPLEKITEYDYVFIFGCGNVGRHICEQLIEDNVNAVIKFCDNYYRAPKRIGIEVLTPEDAFNKHPNALFIIGSMIHYLPMLSQLTSMGVPEENIIAQWIETKSRMTAKPFIKSIYYHLTEHCNLKCAGCLHFSNVAEERYADLNEFRETFGRFIEVMGEKYNKGIMFLGGEPLLHPLIVQFITTAWELLFKKGRISILTNGILLTKMPENFWETCSRCAVHISISGYPVNIDIYAIRNLADKYGVRLSLSSRDSNAWAQYVFDLDGKQDIITSFSYCENANECFIMKGRKLYPCCITACIEHFNNAFVQNLELCKNDSLDIFSNTSAQGVLDFLATPVPFCRYCNREKIKLGQPWKLSKHTINEYMG